MAYTPQLSMEASCTLRRLAWALGVPMTVAIEMVFAHLPKILDRQKVCQGCRDKTRCSSCHFNSNPTKGGKRHAEDLAH